MKKFKYLLLINIILICTICSFMVYARIIYKDITSISIRTNFNFDYETISENGVDDITYSNENDGANVFVYSGKSYEIESAEWYKENTDDFNIGGEPKVIVYLNTTDYEYDGSSDNDYFYRFLSSYNSSNCHISNATFVSATRVTNESLKVIFKINPIKGTYREPTSAYWADSSGNAVWTPDNILNSGYFEVSLYRDNSLVHRIDKYNGTQCNLWQYMTKAGSYSFKVRTVPGTDKQIVAGKSSDYVESDSIQLQENEVNKNGQASYNSNGGVKAGWIQENGRWYFYKPDGSMSKSAWTKYNNKWYYLNSSGEMVTGIQAINNEQFFFLENGSMLTGWLKNGTTYNFYDTTQGSHEGAMCKNAWVQYQGKYFYFDGTGAMAVGWKQVPDNKGNIGYYYFYPEGTTNGLFGYMASNTNINGFQIGADGKWIGG